MSVIIKGDNAFDMSLVSNIKNVQSQYIKFQNIYFKCKSIEDAGGTIFVKRKKGKWQITEAYPHNVYCSVCHKKFAQTHWAVWEDGSLPRNFCPNCGTDMRGEQDG